MLKGAKNTKVDIKYIRQGKTLTTQLILDEVEVKAVPFFCKIDDKTGYIVLSTFNRKTTTETKEALEKLKERRCRKNYFRFTRKSWRIIK